MYVCLYAHVHVHLCVHALVRSCTYAWGGGVFAFRMCERAISKLQFEPQAKTYNQPKLPGGRLRLIFCMSSCIFVNGSPLKFQEARLDWIGLCQMMCMCVCARVCACVCVCVCVCACVCACDNVMMCVCDTLYQMMCVMMFDPLCVMMRERERECARGDPTT